MKQITALHQNGAKGNVLYDIEPNECPYCHQKITVQTYQAFAKNKLLEIVYRCPDLECSRTFIGIYEKAVIGGPNSFEFKSTTVGTFIETEFSTNIKNLSKNFVEIFNQASKAETLNLNHISGIGFRKALEFLIKDYLISKKPNQKEKIKKKFLGKCIKEDIDNVNVKEMAERATWLGNDETHYVRKWENKDISDLKLLIKVTLHWIEMEYLTEQYKNEMK